MSSKRSRNVVQSASTSNPIFLAFHASVTSQLRVVADHVVDVPVHGDGPRVGDGVVEVLEEGAPRLLFLLVQAQRVPEELQVFLFGCFYKSDRLKSHEIN